MEKQGVHRRHFIAYPGADREAENDASQHDRQHQFEVMGGDGEVGIAERFQCRDLIALGGYLAGQHHVQQECRHTEENGGAHK